MKKIILNTVFQILIVLSVFAQIPERNLIVHLTFDDNQLQDQSIYNHMVIDHSTGFTDGVNDSGLLLEESSAFLEVPYAPSLEIPDQLTISVWYKHKTQRFIVFHPIVEQSADEFDGHSRYGIWLLGNDALWACIEPDDCGGGTLCQSCLLYTSPSPRDATLSRMPSSA